MLLDGKGDGKLTKMVEEAKYGVHVGLRSLSWELRDWRAWQQKHGGTSRIRLSCRSDADTAEMFGSPDCRLIEVDLPLEAVPGPSLRCYDSDSGIESA